MVDYLLDWLHNLLVTLATISGIGLLAYVLLREFYPDAISAMQQTLSSAASWISATDFWPVVALFLIVFIVCTSLPHRQSRI